MKTDCIFFKEHMEDDEWHACYECTRTSRLDNNDDLCENCRLWDAYIPQDSTEEQIEKAQTWQNMGYHEQPAYEDYFKI